MRLLSRMLSKYDIRTDIKFTFKKQLSGEFVDTLPEICEKSTSPEVKIEVENNNQRYTIICKLLYSMKTEYYLLETRLFTHNLDQMIGSVFHVIDDCDICERYFEGDLKIYDWKPVVN